MTSEEFKEKFKVGDRVTGKHWEEHEFNIIQYMGAFSCVGLDQKGEEVIFAMDDIDFIHFIGTPKERFLWKFSVLDSDSELKFKIFSEYLTEEEAGEEFCYHEFKSHSKITTLEELLTF